MMIGLHCNFIQNTHKGNGIIIYTMNQRTNKETHKINYNVVPL